MIVEKHQTTPRHSTIRPQYPSGGVLIDEPLMNSHQRHPAAGLIMVRFRNVNRLYVSIREKG